MNIKNTIYSLLPLFFVSTGAYACDDSYRAMDYAGFTVLFLLALSAFLLPVSVLLITRRVKVSRLILLALITLIGLMGSIALVIIDSHPYMAPAALVLAAVSFFLPIAYLFVMAVRVYRSSPVANDE